MKVNKRFAYNYPRLCNVQYQNHKINLYLQVDELNTITTLNDELSTKLENNNTEKLSLICRVNESVETIHKMANEKKEITMKLEEAHNGRNDLQIALNCMHTKVETTEKEINNLKRDMESKIKEHEHITEGKINKNKMHK